MTTRTPTLNDLWDRLDDIEAGLHRASIGPGSLHGSAIRPKSVSAGLINVSDLQAVNSKTGNLDVTGDITMTPSGSFSAGMTDYLTGGPGFWLDCFASIPRFSLGNSGGSHISWDGQTLNVVGTITATSGQVGGFTLSATDLTAGSGSSSIGLSSAGSVRLWMGNATPGSAPFRVSSLGALTATSGSIGGWDLDGLLGLILGTGAATRGISTGSTAFYAGSATPSAAPFRVSTAGALVATDATITGAITATSGSFSGAITATSGSIGGITIGATSISATGWSLTNAGVMTSTSGTIGGLTIGAGDLTVPTGKKLVVNSGLIELNSSGAFGDAIEWKVSGTSKGSVWATANSLQAAYAGGCGILFGANDSYLSVPTTAGSMGLNNSGAGSAWITPVSGKQTKWDGNGYQLAYSRIYPGNNAQQSTGYLAWDGTNLQLTGADVLVSNYLKLAQSGAASATPGNCTKYVAMKDSGGATVFIPAYTSAAFSD
jgi:hypothetical protein